MKVRVLSRACLFSNAEMLLKYGADPNIKDLYGDTPLFKAILFRNLSGLKLLLEYSPYLWATDNNGLTAMDLAARQGESEMYKLLINQLGKNKNLK